MGSDVCTLQTYRPDVANELDSALAIIGISEKMRVVSAAAAYINPQIDAQVREGLAPIWTCLHNFVEAVFSLNFLGTGLRRNS